MLDIYGLDVYIKNKQILREIDLSIPRDTVVGVIGESGSGKSMLCTSILRLRDQSQQMDGSILFQRKQLLSLQEKEMRNIRGKEIGFVMQHPMSMFNPVLKIKSHFVETLQAHKKISKRDAIKKAEEQLSLFQLDGRNILNKYPHELSGGMLQRIMIAIAASLEPKLLIADEPTTALDPINQFEIIHELKRLQERTSMSMLVVSHDMAVIANIANEIIVMRCGMIVERGSAQRILSTPLHPYTQALVRTHTENLSLEEMNDQYVGDVLGELQLVEENHWVRKELA